MKIEGEGYGEKTQLVYLSRKAVLVQLEKAIFSPGQTVRFRVFAIDSLTNAINPEKCSVTIRDSNDNLIETYQDLKFSKGKYENKLALGDKANQGIWNLVVNCGSDVSESTSSFNFLTCHFLKRVIERYF